MSSTKTSKNTNTFSTLSSSSYGLTYSTGTISQSGIIVTGIGTTFSQNLVGGLINIPGIAQPALILGYISVTSLIVDISRTIAAGSKYILFYQGLNSTASGAASTDFALIHNNIVIGAFTNSIYSVGTASVSGVALNGTGTTFTSAMVGGIIRFTTTGNSSMILSYQSASTLTIMDNTLSGASGTYIIWYAGVQAGGTGGLSSNLHFFNNAGSITKVISTGTSNQTLQLPNITTSDTLVSLALTQTLTNKTLVSPILQSTTVLNGNVTASYWGTAGIQFSALAATYTDTTSSGTITTVNAVNALAQPTLAASTLTTYTTATTKYIVGPPIAGINVSITNPYALYIASGTAYFGGPIQLTSPPVLTGLNPNCIVYTNSSLTASTSNNLTYDTNQIYYQSGSTTQDLFVVQQNSTTTNSAIGIVAHDVSINNNSGKILKSKLASDVTTRLQLYTDGIGLGPGGSVIQDVYAYRSNKSLYQIDGDKLYSGTTATTNLFLNGLMGVGVQAPLAKVQLGTAMTQAYWGIIGIGFSNTATTYTDSSSAVSSTINTVNACNALAVPTFAATNTSVTYSKAATLYVDGPPIAGTNVTISNPYSMYVASGNLYFGGNVITSGVSTNTGIQSSNPTYSNGTLSQSTATGTGNGTNFTSNMVGGFVIWTSGQIAFITSVTSTTLIGLSPIQTVPLGTFTLYYSNTYSNGTSSQGLSYSTGTIKREDPNNQTVTGTGTTFTSAMTGGIITISGTGPQIITSFNSTTSLGVSSNYSINTVTTYSILYNQNTLTGVGTTFNPNMVGGFIYFSTTGHVSFISGYTSPTILTIYPPRLIPSQNFIIYYNLGFSLQYQNFSANVPVISSSGTVGVSASTYSTGTISQTGTTITGTGTTFTSSMVGSVITITGFATVYITAFINATTLSVQTSQTVPGGTGYTIYLPSNTVTGASTIFTSMMIGGIILFNSTSTAFVGGYATAFITAYISSTSLTISGTLSVPSGSSYIIFYGGATADSISGHMGCQDLYAYHLCSKTTAIPTIIFGNGAGTSYNSESQDAVVGVSVTGTDTSGNIIFTTGSSPVVNGNILTIYFTRPYPIPPNVFLQGSNAATINIVNHSFLVSTTTSSFSIQNVSGQGGVASTTTYSISWITIG